MHLATAHRVIRGPCPCNPGHTQHFRLFALASAGLEEKDNPFTVQTSASACEP